MGPSQSTNHMVTPRKAFAIRTLGRDDLFYILGQGWRDFKNAPWFGLFFGGIYACGGWLILSLVFHFNAPYVGYPLLAGFALIAPFVAAGTYEVSRCLERGEALTWATVLGAVWQRGGKELGWMAIVTVFTLILWVDFAIFLFLMFFGLDIPSFKDLIVVLLSTQQGLVFIVVGHCVGAVISTFVFSITVVSFPLLADRDIDLITAMITSVRCVRTNPAQMMAWAVLIALMIVFSILTGLLALFVVLPVLGHASWHLYRRLIRA
jgi:uncharacterized membrane protein